MSGVVIRADPQDPGSTRMSLMLQTDMKGWVPHMIVNAIAGLCFILLLMVFFLKLYHFTVQHIHQNSGMSPLPIFTRMCTQKSWKTQQPTIKNHVIILIRVGMCACARVHVLRRRGSAACIYARVLSEDYQYRMRLYNGRRRRADHVELPVWCSLYVFQFVSVSPQYNRSCIFV